ncbi:DUF932 domain-containing protein [Actinomadura sp. 6N118]|uniref:DUF932 domain-containing protein n=1 Tax=Actinomadura sp. 6N118 TaxID=3375151 RepID=UPI00378AD8D8
MAVGRLLREGAVASVSVKVPGTIKPPEGVQFRPHLLGATSFDGSPATAFKRAVTNVVCDNTMAAGLAEAGQQIKSSTRGTLSCTSVKPARRSTPSTRWPTTSPPRSPCCATRRSTTVGGRLPGRARAAPRRRGPQAHDIRVSLWRNVRVVLASACPGIRRKQVARAVWVESLASCAGGLGVRAWTRCGPGAFGRSPARWVYRAERDTGRRTAQRVT